jgi:hypothetical protein
MTSGVVVSPVLHAAQPDDSLCGLRLSVSSSFRLLLFIPAFKATSIDLLFELSAVFN